MSKITNDQLNPVWHRMPHSCAHMAIVCIKGLKTHYTVSQKKHVTTFSAITLTIGVRLQ